MSKPESSASKLVKHSTIYAFGNIARQLIGFVMLPVYTRYLTPADYGVVGLLMFSVSLIEGVFGARLGQAMPKFYFEESAQRERNAVISTALIVSAIASVLVTLAFYFSRNFSSAVLFGSREYSDVVGLFSILILANALEGQSLVYLQIERRATLYVAIGLLRLVVQFTLNILFVVYLQLGMRGIAYSSVTSSSIFAAGLCIYTFLKTGIRCDLSLARRMILFSWPLWLAGVASIYLSAVGRYYIRIFSSLNDVGLYELAAKFGTIITFLVAQPFARYWDTERFNHYKKDNKVEIFKSVFQVYTTLLSLATLGIAIFSEPIIRLMSSASFHQAYLAVPFLAGSSLIRCMSDYCNFSFLVTSKTAWLSKNQYIVAIVVTLFYLALVPFFGFVGAALAVMLTELFQFMFVLNESRKLFDMQIEVKPLMFTLSTVGTAYICATFLFAEQDIVVDILIKSIIFTASAILLLTHAWRNLGEASLVRELLTPAISKLPLVGRLVRSHPK